MTRAGGNNRLGMGEQLEQHLCAGSHECAAGLRTGLEDGKIESRGKTTGPARQDDRLGFLRGFVQSVVHASDQRRVDRVGLAVVEAQNGNCIVQFIVHRVV